MQSLTDYHRSIIHPILLEARRYLEHLDLSDVVYQAFRAQFETAKRRKIDFEFTLETWWQWWQTFDPKHDCIRWERRGIGKDALVMARFGDVGPYSPANVYCATHSQNFKDVDRAKRERSQQELARQRKAVGYQYWLTGKRGDAHPSSRAVITPDGRFPSASAAGEHYGLTRAGAKNRADHGIRGWHWE